MSRGFTYSRTVTLPDAGVGEYLRQLLYEVRRERRCTGEQEFDVRQVILLGLLVLNAVERTWCIRVDNKPWPRALPAVEQSYCWLAMRD